jgi:hypothetical protein
MALAEEALRQRMRTGAELWPHALEDFATNRGLPYAERRQLLALAVHVGRAEDRLRREGLLGPQEVPSLLACHWGEGVHIVRTVRAPGGWPGPRSRSTSRVPASSPPAGTRPGRPCSPRSCSPP